MKTGEILTLILAIMGTAIALGTLVYTVEIGRRNNKIANENLKLASEQENIKRTLRFDILYNMLSIYQSVDDFNKYLWAIEEGNHPIDRNFVYEFYLDRANELTKLRSKPGYFEYLRALELFKKNHKLSKAELQRALKSIGYISGQEKKRFRRVLAGKEIGDALVELEKNTWWAILQTAQEIKAANFDTHEDNLSGNGWGNLLEGKDTGAKKEILRILQVSLHTMGRVSLTLALIKKFESEIVDYLERSYRTTGVN